MSTPPQPAAAAMVAMIHVADVERSARFYATLGFAVLNTNHETPGAPPNWAWLQSNGAKLMVARSDEPVDPARQGVLFYIYVPDVEVMHAHLAAAGLAVGKITTPFFAPRGEFPLTDPDGYCLFVSHT